MLLIIGIDYVWTCDSGTKQEFCGYFTIMASLPLSFLLLGKLTEVQIFPIEVSMTTYKISAVVLYFITGALLGWFYGKIKNRKQIINNL